MQAVVESDRVSGRTWSAIAIAMTLILFGSTASAQSSIDKIRITPDNNDAFQRERSRSPQRDRPRTKRMEAPSGPETNDELDEYDIAFDNSQGLDISEMFLVGINETLPATAAALPTDAFVVRLEVPKSGEVMHHPISYSPNKERKIPLLYVAVFGPDHSEPLWVKVPQAVVRGQVHDVNREADAVLDMAEKIDAAGNKVGAANRYRAIIQKFPGTLAAQTCQSILGLTNDEVKELEKAAHATSQPTVNPKRAELARSARQRVVESEQQQAAAEAEAKRAAEQQAAALAMEQQRQAQAAAQRERDIRDPEFLKKCFLSYARQGQESALKQSEAELLRSRFQLLSDGGNTSKAAEVGNQWSAAVEAAKAATRQQISMLEIFKEAHQKAAEIVIDQALSAALEDPSLTDEMRRDLQKFGN